MLTKCVSIAFSSKATHHVVCPLVSMSLFALYNEEDGGSVKDLFTNKHRSLKTGCL